MRYFWALLTYVVVVILASASCGGGGGTGSGFTGSSSSGGMGGLSATGAGGSGSGTGAGGSTGPGITLGDSGLPPGDACAGALTCKAQGLDCGPATDGCGGILDCGTCPTGQTCGVTTTGVCAPTPCQKVTCAQLGDTCGMAQDGCGGTQDCGTCPTGQTCGGGGVASQCGSSTSTGGGTDGGSCTTMTTCAAQGANCGPIADGCGGLLQCGTCPSGETCGATAPSQCGTVCMPKTCAQLNANCGQVGDGCGGLTANCGTCTGTETCGGAGVPSQCGAPTVPCTGLCLKQTMCTGTATTSISGTVFAPNGTDPLYDVLVYVPNAPVLAFTPGVSCDSCSSSVSGSPLVSATTGVDGTFTITNMPVGTNIPLVIQNGRWRRQFVIPSVASCVNTALPSTGTNQLRFPKTHLEGDIPLMGFVTGSVDTLECVLRKIGIADTEFSDPSGTGRVRFYLGSGSAGAKYSNTTPKETTLWGTQAAINAYDMVLFACQGSEFDQTQAAQQVVVDYANAGGRIFSTHYSYVWLAGIGWAANPFATTATWAPDTFDLNTFYSDPGTGLINTTFPKGLAMAQWLQVLYPTSTLGQIQINTLRHDFTAVVAPSSLWISDQDKAPPKGLGTVPMHYTFNTPVGAAPANQCGRVLYSDFHVEDSEDDPTTGEKFPTECVTTGMTPQERMLEFMLFDLGSCVTPDIPVCTPQTCTSLGIACGPAGDGCGNVIQCGMCPSGETCGGGGTPSQCGTPPCVPETCASQNIACGPAGDGCGNTIPSCGTCPSGQSCGGSGKPGQCGDQTCTPNTCANQNIACGPAGDGCGNLIQCGNCPTGQTCGGGGTPGQCGAPKCVPKTCATYGFNCGSTTDGCGNIITCGTCTGGKTCGGGGDANVCGGGSQ